MGADRFTVHAPVAFCMGNRDMFQLGLENTLAGDNIIMTLKNPILDSVETYIETTMHRAYGQQVPLVTGPTSVALRFQTYSAEVQFTNGKVSDPLLNRSISDLLAAIQVKMARGERV